jgi:hypothetical protein
VQIFLWTDDKVGASLMEFVQAGEVHVATIHDVKRSRLDHQQVQRVCRSTLADANEVRDWRIYADLAALLIKKARRLYSGESIDVELQQSVYALDSTTIDLCLNLFPWARFLSTKGAIKLHTLLDLRGPIPSFIGITDGAATTSTAAEAQVVELIGARLQTIFDVA